MGPDGAVASVDADLSHAGLGKVDDVGFDLLHHLVAESPALHNAGREALGDDVADGDELFGDLEATRSRRLSESPRCPAWKSLNCPERLMVELSGGERGVVEAEGLSSGFAALGELGHADAKVHVLVPLDLDVLAPRAERNRGAPPEASHQVKSRMRTPSRGEGCSPAGAGSMS